MVLIGTDRLRVRPIEAADEPHLRGYAGRGDYCPYAPIEPDQPESLNRYVKERIRPDGLDDGTAMALAIVPGGTGHMVGTISLTVQPFPVPIGHLDFTLDPDFRGRGYMTEALAAVIPMAFREFGLLRISAVCDVDNLASQNVLDRIGLKQTKRMAEHLMVKDIKRDAFLYILDAEAPG